MESEFPLSAREAEEHIRRIRRDKGLGDGPKQIGNNASDLEAALELVAKDLYQTTTHFLLELIQNADDNFYEVEFPTLFITYVPGRVRIDCNERGFTKKNIEAITRICKSTKSGRSKSAGFVGEKGVGFKAVFKVASAVWISSGHYSFKFDRDAHLGMIAPIWDTFPEKLREGYTSILLKLSQDCDENRIISELESYDERMLLFLRRLRKLEIDVTPKIGCRSTRKPFRTFISRHSEALDNPSMTILTKNGLKRNYLVWRQTANNMPTETRRPNISSSEIVLAFPNTGFEGEQKLQPVIESQNVYAFLPIRNSGLPFLLQADFLLPASREDIHLDSPWNEALAATAAMAFISATRYMGDLDSSLHYSWIRYIPIASGSTGFIEGLRMDILKRLQSSKILDSRSGRKKKPASLSRVPVAWRDSTGRPFIAHRSNKSKLLATQYDDIKDYQYLDALGVKLLNQQSFFDEIIKIVGRDTAKFFRSKTKEWHTSFARALLAMNSNRCRELALIPLRDGKWISSNSVASPIYFPTDKSVSAIPDGIKMHIVDSEAAADPARRKLFVSLGVIDLSDAHIRAVIQQTHKDSKFKPNSLKLEVLVSHAVFLFRTRPNETPTPFLIWMAADQGSCRKSDTMYLPSKATGAASSVLPNVPGRSQEYGFLHEAYLQASVSDKERWFEYLQKGHQVSVYPRLFNDLNKTCNYSLVEHVHADFKLLMQGSLNQKCLTLLRDGWEFYKQWFEVDTTSDSYWQSSNYQTSKLNNRLSFLRDSMAPCTGSVQSEKIKRTYMPLARLTGEYGTIAPFLDIPDPLNARWKPLLKSLSVGMEDDLAFYLKCLNGAKGDLGISDDKIRHIMHEIENKLDAPGSDSITNQALVREMRTCQQKIIYIPPRAKGEGAAGRGPWVSPSDCFWRGEGWLTQSIGLEKLYPDLESLFRKHLLVPNAGIENLIREGAALKNLPKPVEPHIKKLFLAFTAHVKASGLDIGQKGRIKLLDMFPIVTTGENEPYEYLTSIANHQPWLIADRANFRAQFEHVIPVLAFSPDFILKIKRFLMALDLKDRFLSQRATSITEAHGDDVKLHGELTKRYRSRSKYLFRLIPEDQKDEKQLREKFRNVEVYMAPRIIQYWRAPLGLRVVHSGVADGAAFLECDYAGDLRIYLRAGYESEGYPHELAEQLRNFFNVPIEQRDLLAAALIAPEKRVDELFEERGIEQLIEEETLDEEGDEEASAFAPIQYPGPRKKSRLRLGDSRFSKLFSHKRFSASIFNEADSPSNTLPSYQVAVARATQSAIGRPLETRTFGSAHRLRSLGVSLKGLEFEQEHGAVVGTARSPPTFLDRIWGLTQRDVQIGETIVSHILAQVLSSQYDKAQMWTPRDQRKNRASFNFTDSQGRFSSFLMRLDGMSGNAQGYTRFTYHMDVKTTARDTESFEITQAELDRAREHSVHNQPNVNEGVQSKHISILVHISGLRKEPKIRFLADPWDLFEDGQLTLENRKTYRAGLQLRLHQPPENGGNADSGFDAVQIRAREDPDEDDSSPAYEKGKGKGKEVDVPESLLAKVEKDGPIS